MLDDDVIEHFRAKAEGDGVGYQTMINAALREVLLSAKSRRSDDQPVTIATLRRMLREELAAGRAIGRFWHRLHLVVRASLT